MNDRWDRIADRVSATLFGGLVLFIVIILVMAIAENWSALSGPIYLLGGCFAGVGLIVAIAARKGKI